MDNSLIFQQDNDRKQTSSIVREQLLYNLPKRLKTPPQSPNANPIEYLWENLKHSITNKGQLKSILGKDWGKIPSAVTEKLVRSMSIQCCLEC